MRKFFYILLFICLSVYNLFGQDRIITLNSDTIIAKIMKVSPTDISYILFSYTDGPTFQLPTTDIKEIIYSNGYVDVYNSSIEKPIVQNNIDVINATILFTDGQSIDVILKEINDSYISYEYQSVLYTVSTAQVNTISIGQVDVYTKEKKDICVNNASSDTIYKAEDFKGGILPKFTYKKVHVPGKKYKKNRYCGGNMVFTEKEFAKFLELYCYDAYKDYKKAETFTILEAVSLLFGVIPVFIFFGLAYSYATRYLATYNSSCATQVVTLDWSNYQQDKVILNRITLTKE